MEWRKKKLHNKFKTEILNLTDDVKPQETVKEILAKE